MDRPSQRVIRKVTADACRRSVPWIAEHYGITEDEVRSILGGEWSTSEEMFPREEGAPSKIQTIRVLAELEAGGAISTVAKTLGVSVPFVEKIASRGRLHRMARYTDVVVRLPSDRSPYGREEKGGPSCTGCLHFHRVAEALPWGICAFEHSPRRGMLTHQTQGGAQCGRTPLYLPDPGGIDLTCSTPPSFPSPSE